MHINLGHSYPPVIYYFTERSVFKEEPRQRRMYLLYGNAKMLHVFTTRKSAILRHFTGNTKTI